MRSSRGSWPPPSRPAPASSTSASRTSGWRRRWARSSPPATPSAAAPRPTRASGSRSSSSRPTRPARCSSRTGETRPTETPSRGCSQFAGHEVEREYYYNDAGAQMELFYASVEAVRRGEAPPEGGYVGDYVHELAKVPGDPVPPMLEQIEATLERFRVHFDTWARESEFAAEIPEALALLDVFEEGGAVWARTTAYGDDKDRVLVRSDGTPTYFAADAAYVRRKYARGFDRLVYVLGADHHGYVAPAPGSRRDARPPARVARGAHLPARPPRRGRAGEEGLQAPRGRRLPPRAAGDDRGRRSALVSRLARPRPDDRARRRPREGADEQEPRLLRPVRARAHRRHPPQRGRGSPSGSSHKGGLAAPLERRSASS